MQDRRRPGGEKLRCWFDNGCRSVLVQSKSEGGSSCEHDAPDLEPLDDRRWLLSGAIKCYQELPRGATPALGLIRYRLRSLDATPLNGLNRIELGERAGRDGKERESGKKKANEGKRVG